jgi:hypothetical protein
VSEEARKAAVFSCEYSEQNPVYCQQCGGHEHLCKKPLSDRWCEYANYLIAHGNDITALSMRTNLLAEMNAHADHTAAIREKALAVIKHFYRYDNCECGVPISLHGNLTSCSISSNGTAELAALKAELEK